MTTYTLKEITKLIKPVPVGYYNALRLLRKNEFPDAFRNANGRWQIPKQNLDALNTRRTESPGIGPRAWSKQELKILRVNRKRSWKASQLALEEAGFRRSRYAIQKKISLLNKEK